MRQAVRRIGIAGALLAAVATSAVATAGSATALTTDAAAAQVECGLNIYTTPWDPYFGSLRYYSYYNCAAEQVRVRLSSPEGGWYPCYTVYPGEVRDLGVTSADGFALGVASC